MTDRAEARNGAARDGSIPAGDSGSHVELLATPVGFATLALRLKLYEWQDEVLTWFEDTHRRLQAAVATPNGAGKTSGIVAALCLWWLFVHPRGRVVYTTKDAKQLNDQFLPAIEAHKGRFPAWDWAKSPYVTVTTPTGGKLVGWTTNDPGRAEGWHKIDDVEGPLLIIVDEAKSVDPAIFQAIDRCTFNALLYISSPGLMMGPFFEAFTKLAAQFKTRKVSLRECPHIPRERIDGVIAKYGERHALVQSSIFGEFMDQDSATAFVFPLSIVNKAWQNPPRKQPGERSAFCDFAGGGDENVLAIRTGNRVEIAATWRDRDTMASVGRFALEFRKAGLAAEEIFADEGGLGKPMVDALWQAGWEINRVNNGARPYDPVYENRGAEMWHETAAAMVRGEVNLEHDPELIAQLTTRKSKVTGEARLGVESKDAMAKRGLPSPDRADAVCGAWTNRALVPLGGAKLGPIDEWREAGEESGLGGMDAG